MWSEDEYLKRCPVCDICGDHITDDYFLRIGIKCYHIDCVEKVDTETYVENRMEDE